MKFYSVYIGEECGLYWSVVWLEAIGSLKGEHSVAALENEINNKGIVLQYTYSEVINFFSTFSQVINVVILGDKDKIN
ncbi:hypothetical protein [Deminuibacter soli]|uniref:Uncharacterized protein n=1 Tax=Deminuibacter soli TaxID=2291815 RepID=A0A3E1NGG0_9BACT|nr:hypothetical protein [Deminuibacter soli]RFM26914.1 hypothetical protein DXN05_18185 [Deminuibacter soli]